VWADTVARYGVHHKAGAAPLVGRAHALAAIGVEHLGGIETIIAIERTDAPADGVVELQVAAALPDGADALAFERIQLEVRWAGHVRRAAAGTGLRIDEDLVPRAVDVAGALTTVEHMVRVGTHVAVPDGANAPA